MDVSIVLATHNRAATLQKTLDTLAALAYPAGLTWELLVVDNNSHDATREVVERFAETANFTLRYLFEAQQGKSAALNTGVAAATGEIITFTDDDVLVHPEWLVNLVRTFTRFPCSAVGGRVVPVWEHLRPDWLEMERQLAVVHFDFGEEFREIRFPPLGANFAFRREVFAKYGLFRLDLGPSGNGQHRITCEDMELALRVLRAGEQIVYCPDAIVYHPVDPKRTTKKYFLEWFYYNGVSLTRAAGLPDFGVFLFGAPRWLYRELLANWLSWMLTFNKDRRFNRRLLTYKSLGAIVESRRLSHLKAAARAPQKLQPE